MKRQMSKWLEEYRNAAEKKAMPILSFPGKTLIDAELDALVHSGRLQADCMEAVAKAFPQAAATVSLMDLSVEAEAFGSKIFFNNTEPPAVIDSIIETEEDVDALRVPEVGEGRTGECVEGIRLACEKITDRPVLAGIIGSFTLAGRLMDMSKTMIACRKKPDMLHKLLEKNTEFLIKYVLAMKAAGANGVVMAEPAAGLINPKFNRAFSLPYVEKIRAACEDDNFLFIYHNCGDTIPQLKDIPELTGIKAVHLGNAIDMEEALRILPERILAMGNLDPSNVFCLGTPELVAAETKAMMEKCGKYPNYAPSSGCDIPPATPMENVEAFYHAVEDFYKQK